MAEYTPTTTEVMAAYVIGEHLTNPAFPVADTEACFRNWLTEHDKPRTVDTVEELDTLPPYAVVRGGSGYVYERQGEGGWMRATHYLLIPSISLSGILPATVLYETKEAR